MSKFLLAFLIFCLATTAHAAPDAPVGAAADATQPVTVAPSAAPPASTTPSAAQPADPAVNPNTTRVDPAAILLVKQSLEAYKAISAYSDNITIGAYKFDVAWQKPGKFRYSGILPGDDRKELVMAVSDGKIYSLISHLDQSHYYKSAAGSNTPAAGGIESFVSQFPGACTVDHLPPVLIQLADPELRGQIHVVSLKAAADGNEDGVPVDNVILTGFVRQPNGVDGVMMLISLGKEDKLIRRVATQIFRQAPGSADFKPVGFSNEAHSNVRASNVLPDATFAFAPPAGISLGMPARLAKLIADERAGHDTRLKAGFTPFPFKVKDLKGNPVGLDQYAGKVLILDFWATWCMPCRGELPNVLAVYKKYHSKGVDVLGVSLDESKPTLLSFIKDFGLPYRQVFDGKKWHGMVPSLYKVQAIPLMIVIGKNGRIAAVGVRGDELETVVRKALSARSPIDKVVPFPSLQKSTTGLKM